MGLWEKFDTENRGGVQYVQATATKEVHLVGKFRCRQIICFKTSSGSTTWQISFTQVDQKDESVDPEPRGERREYNWSPTFHE